jgi:VanZ family protein
MPRPPITAYRLRLLPLAFALIVVTTAMPVERRPAVWWDGTIEPLDLAVNLLLYMPLGLALRRWPWRRVLLVAALLSAVIELAQVWNSDRHASPGDVVANAIGALLAVWAGRRRWRDHTAPSAGIPIGGRTVKGVLCAAVALLVVGNLPARSTAVTGWDSEYPLLLGNEVTGDCPWRGTIEHLALIPGRRSRAELRDAAGISAGATFVTPAAMVVDGGAGVRLPTEVARNLARSVQEQGALTVVARIVPVDTNLNGPASIVSFANDPHHRNFDLGQEGRRLVFRIRTPLSGDDAAWQLVKSTPVLEAGLPVTVVASYDGQVARLHLDGQLRGRANFAATGYAAPMLVDEELPAVCAVVGAMLALIARALVGGRGRWATVLVGLVAGAVTMALPVWAPGLASVMAAMPWATVGGWVGVGAVVVAAE